MSTGIKSRHDNCLHKSVKMERMRTYLCFLVGGVLVATGFVVFIFVPSIIQGKVISALVLSNDSAILDKWINLPYDFHLEVFFFNLTNALEVEKRGAKPLLREVGPYIFREYRTKRNIDWNDEAGVVGYDLHRMWIFDQMASDGLSLTDPIVHVNVPLISSADFIENMKMEAREKVFLYYSLNQMHTLSASSLFPSHTVGEFTFTGYTDLLIEEARQLDFGSEGMNIPFDKFAWFYKKNNSVQDGRFEVYTGRGNINQLGNLYSWKGSTELKDFRARCNSFLKVGLDVFPRSSPSHIRLFFPEVCRPIHLLLSGTTITEGIKVARFSGDQIFNYSRVENRCFCHDGKSCPRDGISDSSKCTFDMPTMISLPHFMWGDDTLHKQVKGMKADPRIHTLYVDMHPLLGIPIKSRLTMQVNVVVRNDPRVDKLKYLPSRQLIIPCFWFAIKSTLHQDVLVHIRTLDQIQLYSILVSSVLVLSGLIIISLIAYMNWNQLMIELFMWLHAPRTRHVGTQTTCPRVRFNSKEHYG